MTHSTEEHARQIEAVHWLGVRDLVNRWGVSAATVRKIARERLPYLLFGDSQLRRYDPRDVERYEDTMKRGDAA
jgi:hypothetical protein